MIFKVIRSCIFLMCLSGVYSEEVSVLVLSEFDEAGEELHSPTVLSGCIEDGLTHPLAEQMPGGTFESSWDPEHQILRMHFYEDMGKGGPRMFTSYLGRADEDGVVSGTMAGVLEGYVFLNGTFKITRVPVKAK